MTTMMWKKGSESRHYQCHCEESQQVSGRDRTVSGDMAQSDMNESVSNENDAPKGEQAKL